VVVGIAMAASQQAEKAAELQDPEIRAALDRRVREEGETVIKSGTGGTNLEAQERLAEGILYIYIYIYIFPRARTHACWIHACVLPYV